MTVSRDNQDNSRSFLTLDALRGIAALAVVQLHMPQLFGGTFVAHGYLAVDFFFMLSGFVLTHAYQRRLDEGWPTFAFLKVRIIRLYPLYLVGVLLGGGFLFLENHFAKAPPVEGTVLPRLILFGLLLLPTIVATPDEVNAFPLNHPSWSLFGEVVANVLHAFFLRRRSSRSLMMTAAILGVPMIAYALHAGEFSFGWRHTDVLIGLFRVMYSYVIGILIYRFWKTGKLRVSLPAFVVFLLLLAVMGIRNAPSWNLGIDLAVVLLAFPCVLFLGACSQALNDQPGFVIYLAFRPMPSTSFTYRCTAIFR